MAWAKPNKAAEHFGVSRRTIWNWMKLGLPHVKIGGNILISLDDGDGWLRENYTPEVKTERETKIVNELIRGL